MIAPGNHGDFGFAARSTTPGGRVFDGGGAAKTRKPGTGDFSQSPVGVCYGVSGWGLDEAELSPCPSISNTNLLRGKTSRLTLSPT